MGFADNRVDLGQMDTTHSAGSRYTYSVLDTDESGALGYIYLLPNGDRMYLDARVTSHDGSDFSTIDATVSFWVRPSTWADGLERTVLTAVRAWLRDAWALRHPVIMNNDHLSHRIATIESLGLVRRFDFDRDHDMYTSRAYA